MTGKQLGQGCYVGDVGDEVTTIELQAKILSTEPWQIEMNSTSWKIFVLSIILHKKR